MTKVIYKGNIDPYLVKMENHNHHVGMSGVTWWEMLERHIPKEALRRLSIKEYAIDSAGSQHLEKSAGGKKYSRNNSPYSTVASVAPEMTQEGKARDKKRLTQNPETKESNILPKKMQPTK